MIKETEKALQGTEKALRGIQERIAYLELRLEARLQEKKLRAQLCEIQTRIKAMQDAQAKAGHEYI